MVYWGTRCIGVRREQGTRYIGAHGILGYVVSWGTQFVWFLGVPGDQAQAIIGVQSYRGVQGAGPRGCSLRNA